MTSTSAGAGGPARRCDVSGRRRRRAGAALTWSRGRAAEAAEAAPHAATPAGRAGGGRLGSGPLGRNVRTKACRPEWTVGGREEHPAKETPAGTWQHFRLQRVSHDKGSTAWRRERERLLLRDQGGDAAGHRGRRLH